MDLISKLPEEDLIKFEQFVKYYGESYDYYIGNEKYLQYWNASKEKLYHIFGDKFILSKPITIEKDHSIIKFEIRKLLHETSLFKGYGFYDRNLKLDYDTWIKDTKWEPESYNNPKNNDFFETWLDFLAAVNFNDNDTETEIPNEVYIQLRHLFNVERFFNNKVEEEIILDYDKSRKPLKLSAGARLTRVVPRVIQYLDPTNQYKMNEIWEAVRIAHSMILNDKRITGELCLSIHPLDFVTMSDNASDWDSCMSWVNDGCYHTGTVEMMNSNNVICCYLKSTSTDMNLKFEHKKKELYNFTWNNKKWRQLVYVDKDILMSGKAYPYQCKALSVEILNWVKELIETNTNWKYKFGIEEFKDMKDFDEEVAEELFNEMRFGDKFDNDKKIFFDTKYMYNDMLNDTNTPYYCYRGVPKHSKIISLAGKTPCLCCGKIDYLPEGTWSEENYNERYEGTGNVVCEDCRDSRTCERCSKIVSFDSDIKYFKNSVYCPKCYMESIRTCPECNEQYDVHRVNYSVNPILLPKEDVDPEESEFRDFHRATYRDSHIFGDDELDYSLLCTCKNCAETFYKKMEPYGNIFENTEDRLAFYRYQSFLILDRSDPDFVEEVQKYLLRNQKNI